jgi:ferredoxin
MYKTAAGPVVWREKKCMGCRFCMVSCPFDMPKFEYNSATPRIRKCVMCSERVRKGQVPACVENCPEEALQFGKRSDLLNIARKRIADNPDQYVKHIYGEREAGGTSWMYLAGVPFNEIGFKTDVGEEPYPSLTTSFLYGVPMVLTLAPALFLAMSKAGERREPESTDEAGAPPREEEEP